jgi:hypothetical protein
MVALVITAGLGQIMLGAEGLLPLKDVQPGMKGIGRTVFHGSKIEEFDVEVLGVLRNIGPKQNAILARLSGGPLKETGVYAGMSGSPVFINGKLAGAVAFAIPFSKEAVAGITPIEEMIDIFEEQPKPTTTQKIKLSTQQLTPAHLVPKYQLPALKIPDLAAVDAPATFAKLAGQTLAPIATPISLSGFAPQALEQFAPQLRSLGLVPVLGGGAVPATNVADDTPLQAGSPISVQLIRGDYEASASGTVTYVNGDRIYAFGHPFLSVGFTQLPMNKDQVLTILPSLYVSSRISASTKFIGSIQQDRNTGIFGRAGQTPKMIPVKINLHTSRHVDRAFRYEIVNDKFLAPFLVNFTIFNTIVSYEKSLGDSTLQLKGKIAIKGHPEVRIEDSFSSKMNAPVHASLAVAAPVNFLLSSGFQNLELENIDLDITSSEEEREAVLDRVWYDKTKVGPGEEVQVTVFLKKDNAEEIAETYGVKIPPNLTPGPISMLISDGNALTLMDARETPNNFIPEDIGQLIKAINNFKKNDRLYVRLFRRERGAVIKGESFPDLPPSMLSIFNSKKTSGGIQPIALSPLAEYELQPTEFVVSGQRTIDLEVINNN